MDIERKDNVFKVSIPAITDAEIRAIDNNFDEIAHKFSEMIIHDKELIIAQRVIQNLRAELEKKDKIINLMAEHIEKDCDFDNRIQTKQQILEYFTNKVEEDIKVLYDTTGNLTSIKALDNNFIEKSKILNFINNELPDDEICKCCSNFDVNGVYLKNELKKLLEE